MCNNSSTGCNWAFLHKQPGLRSNVALGDSMPSLCKFRLIQPDVQQQFKQMRLGFLCTTNVKQAQMWFWVCICVVCAESDLIAICAMIGQIVAIGLFCLNSMDCARTWLYAQFVQMQFIIALCAIIVQIDAFRLFVHNQREMGSNVVLGFIMRSLCRKRFNSHMCNNSSNGCNWAFLLKQHGLRSNVTLGVIMPSLCE